MRGLVKWVARAAGVVAGSVVALVAASVGAALPAPPMPRTLAVPAAPPLCTGARDRKATYRWPLRPFDREHPLRGAFGDPRTVERSDQALDGPLSIGSFTFHNGIDIVARDGTPVYPVVSGIAVIRHTHEVSVHTDGFRIFQYWHIDPWVKTGQRVIAGETILGTVQHGKHHLHFGEISSMRAVNPLARGQLGPYRDTGVPAVVALLARAGNGRNMPLARLHGRIELIADALDAQPLRFGGPWSDKPVSPALVRWQLERSDGVVVRPWRTAVDFRLHEPPSAQFWQTYATGTYQNFPVLSNHLDWGKPGRYLYRLTREPIDTRPLPNGRYVVVVEAGDVCGNRGRLEQRVTVANDNGTGTRLPAALLPLRAR